MKPRLFCFGDSFVDWNVPTYHWTYYLSKHYDVHKFGKFGADNYSILFQLGNLPEYKEGDRVIIVFTEPGRLPRRFYGERKEYFKTNPYTSPEFYKDSEFSKKLHMLKYDEGERWVNGERNIEIEFLKKLKMWMNEYTPIFVTWNEYFHKPVSDFVSLIRVSTNWEEGIAEEKDFHPGPIGCYDMYKILHTLLAVTDKVVDFKIEEKKII
jgi:hypothetical protein